MARVARRRQRKARRQQAVSPLIAANRQTNSERSALLRLPGELRMEVCKHTLSHRYIVQVAPKDISYLTRFLRVSHQIRREARHLFYRCNTFEIQNIEDDFLQEFMRHAGSSLLRCIPSFNISLSLPERTARRGRLYYGNVRNLRRFDIAEVREELHILAESCEPVVIDLARTLSSYGIKRDRISFGRLEKAVITRSAFGTAMQMVMDGWFNRAVCNFPCSTFHDIGFWEYWTRRLPLLGS